MNNVVTRVIGVIIGMAGLRLDLRRKTLGYGVWVALFIAGTVAYSLWTQGGVDRTTAWAYAAFVWVLYYVGNSVALVTSLRTKMISKWGEEKALFIYNAVLGLVFAQQAYAQGAFLSAYTGTLGGPTLLFQIIGVGLIVFGLTVKTWATYTSTLDIYYYNDMFIGRPVKAIPGLVVKGPYKHFKNPMYGVGNLQAYGSALIAGSWEGLILCAFYQGSIFAFYYLFELPFVVRTYFEGKPKLSTLKSDPVSF